MDKYGDLLAKIEQFVSIAEKVFGPYKRQDGRQIVIIRQDNGASRTVSFPKYLMEQHLGRPLHPDKETVDHLDCNYNNNDLSNLRVVPRAEHSADDTRRVKLIKLKCLQCDKPVERSPRLLRDKSKKGKTGPFCGRSCAGRYSRALQLGKITKLPIQPHVQSEYYRRKNVKAFVDLLFTKYS